MEKLQRECHWLESMSVELCARCTICVGTKTEPCTRHEERSCRHHDCGHYIPLDGRGLCCKPGQMLDKKPLKPWIKAIKHISKVRNLQGDLKLYNKYVCVFKIVKVNFPSVVIQIKLLVVSLTFTPTLTD